MQNPIRNKIEKYFDLLWPLNRSLTGENNRKSLKILQELIPVEIHEVPSGKKVFDWTVPKEWNVGRAYIITPDGKKIVDAAENNLHLVSYSIPVNAKFTFQELLPHLHYIEDMPDAIPYRTSYYKPDWGFCLTYNKFKDMPRDGLYEVIIDSELKEGFLTYGDCVLKGETEEEVLFSTYICHPSMANNELSGMLVTAFLYDKINSLSQKKYTYRFAFIPETIGSINYLSEHGEWLKQKLKGGYIISCVGDKGTFTYKKSRRGDSLADKTALHTLQYSGKTFKAVDFSPLGSDERQYCSPGFNLPVGVISRSMFHQYKEYHTSLDNKDFVCFKSMEESVEMIFDFVKAFELNGYYENLNPYCEPQLGQRGLYNIPGGAKQHPRELLRTLCVLNYSDTKHDLIDIAEKNNEAVFNYQKTIQDLKSVNLIR
jgi:aminopeptidase-like protein